MTNDNVKARLAHLEDRLDRIEQAETATDDDGREWSVPQLVEMGLTRRQAMLAVGTLAVYGGSIWMAIKHATGTAQAATDQVGTPNRLVDVYGDAVEANDIVVDFTGSSGGDHGLEVIDRSADNSEQISIKADPGGSGELIFQDTDESNYKWGYRAAANNDFYIENHANLTSRMHFVKQGATRVLNSDLEVPDGDVLTRGLLYSGLSKGTTATLIQALVGSTDGIEILQQATDSVSTSENVILTRNDTFSALFLLVYGQNLSNNDEFYDVVMHTPRGSPTSKLSETNGSPGSRTYSRTGDDITLQMGSGTFDVSVAAIVVRAEDNS